MLNQVLQEIQKAQGPLTIQELSRKLAIDPQALEGMLQFWVRKGRLQNDEELDSCDSDTSSCGFSCNGSSNCVFIAKMPKTYSLPIRSDQVSEKPR